MLSDPRISDSFTSFPAHSDMSQFTSTNGTFGPPHVIPVPLHPMTPDLPMTSDLPQQDFQPQGQMVDQGSFVQDLNSLPPPTALAPMEAGTIGVQNQSCKYDLLSSIPRECDL